MVIELRSGCVTSGLKKRRINEHYFHQHCHQHHLHQQNRRFHQSIITPENGEEDDSVDDIFLLGKEVDQRLCCLKRKNFGNWKYMQQNIM